MYAASAPHAASHSGPSDPDHNSSPDSMGPRPDPLALLTDVLRCYTTRTGPELAALFNRLYAPNAAFVDPFAHASPRQEALLQFLSLTHFFSAVEAVPLGPPTVATDGSIAADIAFKYTWARDSFLSRFILPEVTPVNATMTLRRDAAGAIISHVDHWNSPAVPALPTVVRKANVWALNAAVRLLGWEKELRGGAGAAAADKNEPQQSAAPASAAKEE